MEIIVKKGQNIYDVAIQLYGSVQGVFLLIEDNSLSGINAILEPGTVLIRISDPTDVQTLNFYESRGISFNTEDVETGGYYEDGYFEDNDYHVDI